MLPLRKGGVLTTVRTDLYVYLINFCYSTTIYVDAYISCATTTGKFIEQVTTLNLCAPPRIERGIGSHELPVITTSLKRIVIALRPY